MLVWLQKVWAIVRAPLVFLRPVRFVVIPLLLLLVGLIWAAQGQDSIRALVDFDKKCPHWGVIAWFVVWTTLLALQSWYWARQLLRVDFPGREEGQHEKLETFTPRALGVLAFLIAIAALIRAAFRYGPGWGDYTTRVIIITCVLLGVMLLLFLWFVVWRRKKLGPSPRVDDHTQLAPITKGILRATLIIALLFIIWTAVSPLTAGIMFPSPVLLMFSAALWVGVGSWVAYKEDLYRIPLVLTLLILALVFSYFNDNHTIRTLDAAVPARPNVATHFDQWYAKLKAESRNTPVVYVVATEGGGIRAAYWTAAVLTAIQEQSPEFSKHVFAISSVSGGSLGSAVYTSLVAAGKSGGHDDCNREQTSIRFAAQQALSYDFLAPTLGSMLHADFAQRFLPVGFIPDRQRALEHGWERGWKVGVRPSDDFFGTGMMAMYSAHANDLLPSMFLNATNVERGRRSIASNCAIDPKEVADTDDLFVELGRDMPISAAAGNSARFTYVSPAGSRRPDGKWFTDLKGHVVDGGYFENSGAATATDIARVIKAAHPEVDLRLILIKFVNIPEPPVPPTRFANEVLSPVNALLNTRGGRGVLAYQQAHDLFPNYEFHLGQVEGDIVLPLGWLLARRTRNAIDMQIGPEVPPNLNPRLKPTVQQNVDNLKAIVSSVAPPGAVLKTDVVQQEAAASEQSLKSGAQ